MHSENLTKIINTEDIRNYLILKFNVFLLLCVFDLSLSSYQVWPRSQTEDLGSHPSKCMLKFFNFFFNFCYTYKKKILCLEEILCGVLYYPKIFHYFHYDLINLF